MKGKQTNLFHYSILNFFLTCSSFRSSVSLTVFIKLFLIQKSKSSTNLNLKQNQKKQLSVIWEQLSSGQLYGVIIRGQKSWGNIFQRQLPGSYPIGNDQLLSVITARAWKCRDISWLNEMNLC